VAESGGGPGGRATVRVCTRIEQVPAAEWAALTARSPASLCGSRAWLEAALSTVDRDLRPHLLVTEVGGRVAGLLPLVRAEHSQRPLLRFAAAPFNDLADLLALPGHEATVARASVKALLATAADGWAVRLDDLDPAGALARADPERRIFVWEPGFVAPTIDLRDPAAIPAPRLQRRWDRLVSELRGSHRVAFRLRAGAEAIDAMGEFMRQRESRLRALGRDLALPPSALPEVAVRKLAPLGACGFMEMLVDGTAVARDPYLLDGGVAMLWLRALDMDWLRYSCGHLLLRASVEMLASRGYETLDLGRGDERYKFEFRAVNRVLLNARLSAH
jgi:CelD/BcsL family acetyltransferase involved in cellulose biosynthesis